MSESKHTPGPWELDLHDDHSYIRRGGEVIATVDTWMDERPEADARLIAKSPELRDTCETLLTLVRVKYGNLDADVSEFIAKTEKLLAEITGEQQ